MHKLSKQAFTLIELLVVIAIIGILSGLIIASMNGSINSANDAKRRSNIDAIRKALIVYGTLNKMAYPTGAPESTGCNIGPNGTTNRCTNLASALSELIPTLPSDPVSGYYTYTSDGVSFTLSALLSTSNFYNYSSSTGFSNTAGQIFTTVGTTNWIAPSACTSINVLVVAGGGGGGSAGGGAGGIVTSSNFSVTAGTSYPVVVGAGGSGSAHSNGGNSSFSTLTAIGGGNGGYGCSNLSTTTGGNGGSGGGGWGCGGTSSGGTGTQGYAGGSGTAASPIDGGGGGGGAGGLGANGPANVRDNLGGIGIASSISGTSVVYAAGGKGNSVSPSISTPNTGNGGDGPNKDGGSGIVIIHCK